MEKRKTPTAYILFTNPHGQCCLTEPGQPTCLTHSYEFTHLCDFGSRENTLELFNLFKSELPHAHVDLLLGSQERTDFDLNRPSSNYTSFHTRLMLWLARYRLVQLQDQKDLILDQASQFVHCTNHSTLFLQQALTLIKHNFTKVIVLDIHSFPSSVHDYGPFELVFLVLPTDLMSRVYAFYLLAQLIKSGIVCTIFEASPINEIISQAQRQGFPALLFEFNEQLSVSRKHVIQDQLFLHMNFLLDSCAFPVVMPIPDYLPLKVIQVTSTFCVMELNIIQNIKIPMMNLTAPVLGTIQDLVKGTDHVRIVIQPFLAQKPKFHVLFTLQVSLVSSEFLAIVVKPGNCVFRGQTLARLSATHVKKIHLSWKGVFVMPLLQQNQVTDRQQLLAMGMVHL